LLPAIRRGPRYSVGESKFKIQKSKLLLSHPPDILLFFGRLHPLLVHLPIGLIVLLAGLEFLARYPRFKHANTSAGFILALAVPLAIGTAICGWLLSLGGGYEARLVQWHKWTGLLTAAACAVTAWLYRLPNKRGYRLCLGLNLLVLVVASHFGGSLTHGSDYLTRYAPTPFRNLLARFAGEPTQHATRNTQRSAVTDPNALPAFPSLIQPLFEKDCVSCHGPEKSKGHLRLDSFAAVLKGGENGPVVVPGKAAESDLIKRLKLPAESDDHMPPDGKPQPSSDDIALLQWWIDAGAPADKKVGDLHPPANVQRILAARLGAPPPSATKTTPPQPLQAVLPRAVQLSSDLGIVLAPISQTESWLQCNASVAGTNFGDAELVRLVPLGANLRWLDLGGTRITDAGLAQLAGFPNLSRLHLERTALTDAGLTALTGLAQLEYLDLYGTAVTDGGLEQLQRLPRLKQLYLWETHVTPAAAKTFTEARTDKDQIQRWQEEIEQLKAKIKDQAVSVELGTVVAAAPATNPVPMNAQCPISGKPVNPAKTVLHETTLIGFCCDDCKAQFVKDPKPILAKLGLTSTNTESPPKVR
jgi:uncharacterized membrane protein